LKTPSGHITYQVPDIAWLKRGGGEGKIQRYDRDADEKRERTVWRKRTGNLDHCQGRTDKKKFKK